MKKILALILCICLTVPVLTACEDRDEANNGTSASSRTDWTSVKTEKTSWMSSTSEPLKNTDSEPETDATGNPSQSVTDLPESSKK